MKKFILFPFILSSLIIGQSYVLNFDGSNDYLSVAASDNASTKLDGQFTISAWVFIEGADKQQIIYNDEFEVEWYGTAGNFFTKATSIVAALFIICSLALTIVSRGELIPNTSVIDKIEENSEDVPKIPENNN